MVWCVCVCVKRQRVNKRELEIMHVLLKRISFYSGSATKRGGGKECALDFCCCCFFNSSSFFFFSFKFVAVEN